MLTTPAQQAEDAAAELALESFVETFWEGHRGIFAVTYRPELGIVVHAKRCLATQMPREWQGFRVRVHRAERIKPCLRVIQGGKSRTLKAR